ncbi:nuclease A inhibitor family protein [Pontibacter harenae]|uniref:nuclease A inhibitor family protein n=1 Tax=Pontibacter harenae TaxID=2894083 RepID=UPI001E30918A|nr:nuclease A inhibitor family protein [Pontibacter harenae]MCC9167882.1 nuclease A inhibitor family protein [Pontibacter harenae]
MDPILNELQQAADGLYFRSESDHPFETVDMGRAEHLDPSPEQLLAMLGRPFDVAAETVDLPYFLRNMTRVRPEQSENRRQEAERFQALEQTLLSRLSNVKVIRLGSVRVEAFILGSTPQGRLVGLKTNLVET